MTPSGTVIENPVSGERIVITGLDGDRLRWELFLAAGGRVPSSHSHPEQEERFQVRSGRMRFRVGRRRVTVGPGGSVTVPPGTTHRFANAGPGTAHVLVETSPPLRMEELLATAADLAHGPRGPRRLPRPADLALFMRDFEREVSAPYLPAPLVRLVVRPVAWLCRRLRLDTGYRRRTGGAR